MPSSAQDKARRRRPIVFFMLRVTTSKLAELASPWLGDLYPHALQQRMPTEFRPESTVPKEKGPHCCGPLRTSERDRCRPPGLTCPCRPCHPCRPCRRQAF